MFTLSNKDIYYNIDAESIRCKQECRSDVTLTETIMTALSWWLGVEKIFYYKYKNHNFPANSGGLADTIALSIDVDRSLVNCIKVSSLSRKMSSSRRSKRKDIKKLLQYIMIPENKLLSKFVDYLIKNDYSINNLLENFIENGYIVKDEYNVYLDTIKKINEAKANEAKAKTKSESGISSAPA